LAPAAHRSSRVIDADRTAAVHIRVSPESMPEAQISFEAIHKQWTDTLVLTSGGKFWRLKGFKGFHEGCGSSGLWERKGSILTIRWFKWIHEELETKDGGRSFQGIRDYQFTLRLHHADKGVPEWLFTGLSSTESVAGICGLLKAQQENFGDVYRRGRQPSQAQIAALLRELASSLNPFAKAAPPWASRMLRAMFSSVGWDVAHNISQSSRPPTAEELNAFWAASLNNMELGAGGAFTVPPALSKKRLREPELTDNPDFAKQQRADADAAFGDADTTVWSPEWCNKHEPSMDDVKWGSAPVGLLGVGDAVPQSCLLWDWVANVVNEMTFPDPRQGRGRPEIKKRGECYAASALLGTIQKPGRSDTPVVALATSSGAMYLIAHVRNKDGVGSAPNQMISIAKVQRPIHISLVATQSSTRQYQHLTLLCGIVVAKPDGLGLFVEDVAAWCGRTMIRRPKALRVALIEAELSPVWKKEQRDPELSALVKVGGITVIEQRQFSHRVDWGYPSPGVIELVDPEGAALTAHEPESTGPISFQETTFEREYTLCFWLCVDQCDPSDATDSGLILERGHNTELGECPMLRLDENCCVCASVNVDPGPACIVQSSSLADGGWRHIALCVRQSQRLVELLIDGELSCQSEMSADGKLFTNGSGMVVTLGPWAGGAEAGGCIAYLQVYPHSALSRGAVLDVFQSQRDLLGERATALSDVAPELAALHALPADSTLIQRVQALASGPQVGWPPIPPAVLQNRHGWLTPAQKVVLAHLLGPHSCCVVELGGWLGKATRFIRSRAPGAIVFTIDPWVNEPLQNEREYIDDGTLQTSTEQQRLRRISAVLQGPCIYDVFLANQWTDRFKVHGHDEVAAAETHEEAAVLGVVPLRMTAAEGLDRLHAAGIEPDLIYVDAAMQYESVKADLRCCRRLFPGAALCGAGWELEGVRRAVRDVAWRDGDGLLHAEGCLPSLDQGSLGQGWMFGNMPDAETLKAVRSEFYDNMTDDVASKEKWRLLSRECRSGEAAAQSIKRMLGPGGDCHGMPVDYVAPPKGRTLLMAAAVAGYVEIAELLILEFGADVNVQTKSKLETALHLAAYYGQLEVVKLLLSVPEPADCTLVNDEGETAEQAGRNTGHTNPAAFACADWIKNHNSAPAKRRPDT
jgi:hypothetical protein